MGNPLGVAGGGRLAQLRGCTERSRRADRLLAEGGRLTQLRAGNKT